MRAETTCISSDGFVCVRGAGRTILHLFLILLYLRMFYTSIYMANAACTVLSPSFTGTYTACCAVQQ